jgi:hypothetical protein
MRRSISSPLDFLMMMLFKYRYKKTKSSKETTLQKYLTPLHHTHHVAAACEPEICIKKIGVRVYYTHPGSPKNDRNC